VPVVLHCGKVSGVEANMSEFRNEVAQGIGREREREREALRERKLEEDVGVGGVAAAARDLAWGLAYLTQHCRDVRGDEDAHVDLRKDTHVDTHKDTHMDVRGYVDAREFSDSTHSATTWLQAAQEAAGSGDDGVTAEGMCVMRDESFPQQGNGREREYHCQLSAYELAEERGGGELEIYRKRSHIEHVLMGGELAGGKERAGVSYYSEADRQQLGLLQQSTTPTPTPAPVQTHTHSLTPPYAPAHSRREGQIGAPDLLLFLDTFEEPSESESNYDGYSARSGSSLSRGNGGGEVGRGSGGGGGGGGGTGGGRANMQRGMRLGVGSQATWSRGTLSQATSAAETGGSAVREVAATAPESTSSTSSTTATAAAAAAAAATSAPMRTEAAGLRSKIDGACDCVCACV